MSVERLADHVLAVVHREGNSVTNLELQKVLFFTVGMSIRENPDREIEFFNNIYDNDFEKWRYGPVVPSVYFNFNVFGNMPIENNGIYSEDYQRFDDLILRLSNINVYRLVALSHDMSAWADYESDIMQGNYVAPYTIEEIVRDFINE